MDESDKYIGYLALLLFAAFIATYFLASEQYHHPAPAQNCDGPQDYPICERAAEPAVVSPPEQWQIMGSNALLGLIMLSLLLFCAKASVWSHKHSKEPESPGEVKH